MQRSVIFVAILGLTFASCVRPEKLASPSREEILASLTVQPSVSLPEDPAAGCAVAETRTVADYYAWLLRMLGEGSDGKRGLDVTCSSRSGADGAFDCLVMAYIDNGEPWSYGIRFVLRRDRTLVPASVSCPGTP